MSTQPALKMVAQGRGKMDKERPVKQSVKMERIMFYLDSCKDAVQTPEEISRGTGLKYSQVLRALRIETTNYHRDTEKKKRVRWVGSQYQTYYYSVERCCPIEIPF